MIRCIPALSLLIACGTASAQESATYSYDVHGRLIDVARSSGADTSYAYDDADNRISKETTGASSLLQQGQSRAADESAAATDKSGIETENREEASKR